MLVILNVMQPVRQKSTIWYVVYPHVRLDRFQFQCMMCCILSGLRGSPVSRDGFLRPPPTVRKNERRRGRFQKGRWWFGFVQMLIWYFVCFVTSCSVNLVTPGSRFTFCELGVFRFKVHVPWTWVSPGSRFMFCELGCLQFQHSYSMNLVNTVSGFIFYELDDPLFVL